MKIQLKRVYEEADAKDGQRILVDRLWPRGVKKSDLVLDEWLKQVAPSGELRKWFGHDPQRWEEFRKRYRAELKENEEALQALREMMGTGTVTLLYAAKDEKHHHALVLREYLLETS